MGNKIVLHIGLHKTATKYFQHHVFPFLSREKYLYNPRNLDQYMMDYLMAEEEDKAAVLLAIENEKQELFKNNPGKTIIISRESMAGNLFSAYKYWNDSAGMLKNMFPEAMILVSLRYQPDWLVSCYRESIHEHHYQDISSFLTYDGVEKKFLKPQNSRNTEGYANLYALNLDYTQMLTTLWDLFTKENVCIYFYENFKSDPKGELKRVLRDIGSEDVTPKPVQGIPNRGYSALSIELSIARARILKNRSITHYLHRPIFFYGRDSIPAGNIDLSILDKNKYWGEQFKRDNEEVRSPDYPNRTEEETIEYEKSWRFIVKNILDIKEYIDWDLLGDMRSALDEYYKNINKKLFTVMDKNVVPSQYYK